MYNQYNEFKNIRSSKTKFTVQPNGCVNPNGGYRQLVLHKDTLLPRPVARVDKFGGHKSAHCTHQISIPGDLSIMIEYHHLLGNGIRILNSLGVEIAQFPVTALDERHHIEYGEILYNLPDVLKDFLRGAESGPKESFLPQPYWDQEITYFDWLKMEKCKSFTKQYGINLPMADILLTPARDLNFYPSDEIFSADVYDTSGSSEWYGVKNRTATFLGTKNIRGIYTFDIDNMCTDNTHLDSDFFDYHKDQFSDKYDFVVRLEYHHLVRWRNNSHYGCTVKVWKTKG